MQRCPIILQWHYNNPGERCRYFSQGRGNLPNRKSSAAILAEVDACECANMSLRIVTWQKKKKEKKEEVRKEDEEDEEEDEEEEETEIMFSKTSVKTLCKS